MSSLEIHQPTSHSTNHGAHHSMDNDVNHGRTCDGGHNTEHNIDGQPHHRTHDAARDGADDGTDDEKHDRGRSSASDDGAIAPHQESHWENHGATVHSSPLFSPTGQEDDTEWFPVTSEHWGMRVDAFLALFGPDHSRTQWQTLVDLGGVKLWPRGTVPANKDRLQSSITGLVIDHAYWPKETSALVPCAMDLTIYYEDDDMAVIEKPAGLVVHPGNGTKDTPTLVHGLLAHWPDLSTCGGSHKPGLVHRLDKETSGLLMVAKHDKAHRLLNQAFAARQVVKKYWAFVWGTPKPHFGRIHTHIGRHPTMRTHQAVIHGSGGREAITTYRVIRRHDTMSVLECGLLTGRTHQIRVHCAHIGHPIVGDAMYGQKKPWSRHGLHAHFLEFAHPIHHTVMQFASPLPPDLQALWDLMGACSP